MAGGTLAKQLCYPIELLGLSSPVTGSNNGALVADN